MYENVIGWAALGLLFVLCLPISGVQRLILLVYGWAIRLTLMGLVGAAAYLWFRPQQIPVEVTDTVNNFAWLRNILPETGTPLYGMCLVGLIAVVLLPMLMVIDVCRRRSVRGPMEVVTARSVDRTEPVRIDALPPPPPIPSRHGRRAAADAMAQAGASKT